MSGLRWSGKVALVTGANSGIGAAVTRRLLKLGLTVIALDRNVDDIQVHSKLLYNNTEIDNLYCFVIAVFGDVTTCSLVSV